MRFSYRGVVCVKRSAWILQYTYHSDMRYSGLSMVQIRKIIDKELDK